LTSRVKMAVSVCRHMNTKAIDASARYKTKEVIVSLKLAFAQRKVEISSLLERGSNFSRMHNWDLCPRGRWQFTVCLSMAETWTAL
jgi:hypothetical protein